MKIYFAYRSGYLPNQRYLKTLEADSILSWFIDNWEVLCSRTEGAIENLLGARPYGFPISDYQTEQPVSPPQNLDDLQKKLENFVYSNEVVVAENCVQVFTDDDEIELAWYVFDEQYVAQNPDKISLWFNETLPVSFSAEPSANALQSSKVLPHGAGAATTYLMSCMIYDSGNFDDLAGAARIEGVAVPELLNYFRAHETLGSDNESLYVQSQLLWMQQLSKLFPNANQQQLFEKWTQYPLSLLDTLTDEAIPNVTRESLQDFKIVWDTSKSQVRASEHLIEVLSNAGGFFHYTVIFDSYWLHENFALGQSLAHFCSTWEI